MSRIKKISKKKRSRLTPGESSSAKTLWVVGLGASAGGVEPVKRIFEQLNPHTGMAFILAQHSSRGAKNLMASSLSEISPMPIRPARTGLKLRPNNVYIVPPRKKALIEQGAFVIKEAGRLQKPVDELFKSIARSHKNCSVGIVLSGTGDDGAEGITHIKRSGGKTYAQSEDTADFDGMPVSALKSNSVDQALSPDAIARELNEMANIGSCRLDEALKSLDDKALEKIYQLIFSKTHLDFSSYKSTTIQRRVVRRMQLSDIKDINGYLLHLKKHPEEIARLYDDLLINVTRFFRDPESFEILRKKAFPSFLKSGRSQLRMWIPGCSTGEEVYSLAISLFEFMGTDKPKINIQIFGTDVSERSLEKARNGVYKPNIAEHVSQAQLKRFFVKVHGGYQIAKFVRDVCIFARQDVTRDPPFSRMDLISCRNLLIYLDSTLQDKIVPVFHYALNPSGFLLLGSSESIRQFSQLFLAEDKQTNLYIKKNVAPSAELSFSLNSSFTGKGSLPLNSGAVHGLAEREILREMDRLLLEHAPASLLVNEDMEILQFRGDTKRFLDFPAGKASLNLQKMVKGVMLFDLRELIEKVKEKGKGRSRSLRKISECKIRGKSKTVSILVSPLRVPAIRDRLFLVVLQDVTAPESFVEKSSKTGGREARQLRHELEVTRDFLEASIEKAETMNEELRSANEEILSSNEELQSTNEELETAKEELQSTNEELTTVNESLKSSLEQLTESNEQLAEAQAISHLGSWNWEIPVNKVRWSEEMHRIYGISAGAELSFEAVLSRVHPEDQKLFEKTIRNALKAKRPFMLQHRIIRADGETRILQARGRVLTDGRGKAVRMTGTGQDITELLSIERSLRESEEKFKLLVEQVQDYAIYILDPKGIIQTWNAGAQRIKGYQQNEIIGKHFSRFYSAEDKKNKKPEKKLLEAVSKGKAYDEGWRIRKDGSRLWAHVTITALHNSKGQLRGFAKLTRDMTEKRNAEELLKQANAGLERRVEERTRELKISEARYLDLYENAPVMLFSVNVKTKKIIQCNKTLLKTLGFKREEFVGKKTLDFYHPDSRATVKENLRKFEDSGAVVNSELRVLTKAGKTLDVLLNAAALKDEKGHIVEMRSSWRDVTQKKEAQRAYEASERRFRSTFYNAAVGIAHTDIDGRLTLMNRKFCEILGHSEAALLGKNFLDLSHSEDEAHARRFFARLIKGEIEFYNLEKRYTHKKGHVVWVDSTISLLKDEEGRPVSAIAVIEDITPRKAAEEALGESQERLRAALDASQTSTFRWNILTNHLEWEGNLKALFGVTKAEQIKSIDDFKELIHRHDRQAFSEAVKKSASEGADFFMTYRVVHPEGKVRWILDKGSTVRDEKGNPSYMSGACVDITAFKEAQQALELSQDRLSLVAQSTDLGLWYCDLPFDKLVWNDKCKAHFGLPADAAVTIKDFFQRIHPDDRKTTEKAIQNSIDNGNVFDSVYRTVAPDGRLRWIRALGKCFYDYKGQPRSFDGVTIDISDQKEVQKKLQQQNQMLMTLNSIGRTLSGELDLQNLVQFVTDAATQICRAQFGAFFYNVKEENKESYTLYTLSGVPREHFSNLPMPRNTAIFGPTFRGEGTVRLGNVHKDPRFGKNPPYNGLPKGHPSVVSYLAVPVISRSGEVLGGLFFGHEKENIFTEDHERIIEAVAAQSAIAIDNARLYEKLQKEIEEKQAAGEILAKQAETLFRTNEDLRQFAYIASHDLQEPLRTISTFSELLSDEFQTELEEKAHGYINITVHAAKRAQNLVEDLLDYCRLDRPEDSFEEVDINEVMTQTLESLKPSIEATGAEIVFSELPVLKASRVQLGQLFQNLLGNALKFRGKEPPQVRITAESKDEETWLFSIKDNGIGLEEKYAEKIFVIFQRLHHRSEYEGTGIGLAICKKIVERHGGRIWVSSKPGEGAEFFFTLKAAGPDHY